MKYTLLYICIGFLFSCGTSKRSVESKSDSLISASISDSILRKDSIMSLEQLLHSEHLQAHIIVTEWSEPDSTGKQYPVKTTEVNIDKDKMEQFVKSEQTGSEAIQVKKDDTVQIEREKKKEIVKTDTRLIPKWVWWFWFVGGLIFALLYWLTRQGK